MHAVTTPSLLPVVSAAVEQVNDAFRPRPVFYLLASVISHLVLLQSRGDAGLSSCRGICERHALEFQLPLSECAATLFTNVFFLFARLFVITTLSQSLFFL